VMKIGGCRYLGRAVNPFPRVSVKKEGWNP